MNIKELAKKLNLSITTVSRALGGYSDVSEKTREKVKKYAQKYSLLILLEMINTLLFVLTREKPSFNAKGYCSNYSPSGPRRALSYYCCDKDHLIIHPVNIFEAASHPNEDWIKYYIDKGEI